MPPVRMTSVWSWQRWSEKFLHIIGNILQQDSEIVAKRMAEEAEKLAMELIKRQNAKSVLAVWPFLALSMLEVTFRGKIIKDGPYLAAKQIGIEE